MPERNKRHRTTHISIIQTKPYSLVFVRKNSSNMVSTIFDYVPSFHSFIATFFVLFRSILHRIQQKYKKILVIFTKISTWWKKNVGCKMWTSKGCYLSYRLFFFLFTIIYSRTSIEHIKCTEDYWESKGFNFLLHTRKLFSHSLPSLSFLDTISSNIILLTSLQCMKLNFSVSLDCFSWSCLGTHSNTSMVWKYYPHYQFIAYNYKLLWYYCYTQWYRAESWGERWSSLHGFMVPRKCRKASV